MNEQLPNDNFINQPVSGELDRVEDAPQMSEAATLGNIFFEPGRVFEDLRRKPRFLLAGLLIILAITLFQFLFIQKIGYERLIRERIENNPRTEQLTKEEKDKIIEQQSGPIMKYITYGATPIVIALSFLLGGLIYWLGANAMGGSARFPHGLSTWIYSGLPPALVFMLANILVLMFKSVDDIDVNNTQTGLVQANPAFFIDGKANPVLAALLGSIDLFSIWGWILAAIGLQKVAKISSGSAWAIVLIVALIGVTFRVVMSLLFG